MALSPSPARPAAGPPRPGPARPLRHGLPVPARHPPPFAAFWNRGGKEAAGNGADAQETTAAAAPPPPPPPASARLPADHAPVVVKLPILPGDTVKSLARRHGLSLGTVRAAAGHKSQLPPSATHLSFLAPASLGPRARRAAGDLAASLVHGVPPPAQPRPWTASMAGPLSATARMAAGIALVYAGCSFWGAVGRAGARVWARPP